MAPTNLRPLNFSNTQRVVLLIDLHPLLTLRNPFPYVSAVTAAANRLLGFSQLSGALSAFKLFFSSLSPLRSTTVLPRHLSAPALSFNFPAETLASLSATLSSVTSFTDLPNSQCCARASYAASSLLQLIHDYAWEAEKDSLFGGYDSFEGDFMKTPSNLVILLSSIGQSVNCFVDYMESREFDEVFSVVREAFAVRDIHLCWVDVKSNELGAVEMKTECGNESVMLKDGIRKMGWGFCSSDFIVLGSALLPLDLIYPKIGISSECANLGGLAKRKHSGDLSLEILDVNGKPLEYKCCNLEFVNLKSSLCSIESNDIWNASESRDSLSLHAEDGFRVCLGKGNLKLHVNSVHRYDECEKVGGPSEIVLVRECFQELGKNRNKRGDDCFSDRVLEILHGEMGKFTSWDTIPTWQIFLSFLSMNGYWALVSLSGTNGESLMGTLRPFTSDSAILYILDVSHVSVREKGEYGEKNCNIYADMDESSRCSGSQTSTSTSDNCEQYRDGKRRSSQRRLYKEMTWSSFCKAAFEGSNFDLFELYVARYFEKSKKLKFLKCWMKQITKVDQNFLTSLPGFKSVEELSAFNALSSCPSPEKDGVMPVSNTETSETFFNNLSQRIQHGLESGMDLHNLAARVVRSSIHWLSNRSENENNCEGHEFYSNDSYREDVCGKLMELLLKPPKEMKKTHRDSDSGSSSENIVREYELQVLLRMEILQSEALAVIEESRKQKLIKQICSLLEILQYIVAGGIHGHVSLYDYVERTIRARYSDALEDVVNKIYTKMDLLPFGDEEEAPSHLFNSEDSNQSWRDNKYDRPEKAEANSINQSVSTEGESSQPFSDAFDSSQVIGMDEQTRILNKARERREKARRFAPFIGKARDLQRVWAPKQPKAIKGKYDSLPKKSKRKDRQTPGYSVVCETPLTGNKHEKVDKGNSSCSVSKALFQDN